MCFSIMKNKIPFWSKNVSLLCDCAPYNLFFSLEFHFIKLRRIKCAISLVYKMAKNVLIYTCIHIVFLKANAENAKFYITHT